MGRGRPLAQAREISTYRGPAQWYRAGGTPHARPAPREGGRAVDASGTPFMHSLAARSRFLGRRGHAHAMQVPLGRADQTVCEGELAALGGPTSHCHCVWASADGANDNEGGQAAAGHASGRRAVGHGGRDGDDGGEDGDDGPGGDSSFDCLILSLWGWEWPRGA